MSRPRRVVLGAGAVWLGILVTHVTFCLVLGARVHLLNSGAVSGVWFAVMALFVGAIPAVVVGWGLALPLGLLMRPVARQWLHVAAFGILGLALGMPFGGFNSPPDLFAAAAMGTSAAVGRLAVWKLARQSDDSGSPAHAPDVP
ncbi:vacuolar-type H+-ATPase subunit I/STV1 [Arthrobacter sp. PvP023]|uniref:hypothetical protein n=1 Tax=Micrococcaceae TaxID=1268 RepID=UPI001AE103CA|nr:hypothetical protein [Arthrobacter sp. PvP023]MBP1137729.1 vacuolar-type H+-ATPase subunit I/STV1 [Arthrobacter sp. PvP023]